MKTRVLRRGSVKGAYSPSSNHPFYGWHRFCGPGVCVRKPILLALRASVRKLRRRPGRLFSFGGPGFAYENRFLWLCGQAYANSAGGRAAFFLFPGPGFAYENRFYWLCGQAYANSAGARAGLFAPPLPANPYALVSGSKIFTQLPASKCIFDRTPAGLFAPPCPQILMPSFRGAKTPAAVPNRCRGFSISLFLCYILISSMPAFPHTHRRCTAYP